MYRRYINKSIYLCSGDPFLISALIVGLRLNSTTGARPDPHGLFRETGPQTRVSDEVRGLCLIGSGRARVVEFSYYGIVSESTKTRNIACLFPRRAAGCRPMSGQPTSE